MIESCPNLDKNGVWIGRCMVPTELAYNHIAGPHVVKIENGFVYDLSFYCDSTVELFERKDYRKILMSVKNLRLLGKLTDIWNNSFFNNRNYSLPFFLSPVDFQAIKACGVTFVASLIERLIEEKAQGDLQKAAIVRNLMTDSFRTEIKSVIPGSPEAIVLKEQLIRNELWSQYLEVAIGKNPEVFTKAQPLSSVGVGAEIGILDDSIWNNPEPEIVLIVSSKGQIIGASLGNDVNLRDYEGRSALLLGEAKDQNGSCSIGPFIRLFDELFTLSEIASCEITLKVEGLDGFVLNGVNNMNEISRTPENLVKHVIGSSHQYPDGLALFLGTMFAPTENRIDSNSGFTHKIGDKVSIATPMLGELVNWVNTCDKIPKWEFGFLAYCNFLQQRQAIPT